MPCSWEPGKGIVAPKILKPVALRLGCRDIGDRANDVPPPRAEACRAR